ncbi:MAG: multidrug effflux MFS transporter [Gammaproteobacteria bacterium]
MHDAGALDAPWRVVLLALVFGIVAVGTDMYLPALPAIRAAFATTTQVVQLSLSVFLYGNALGQLVYGPLSDRYGRRPLLLGGLATYAVASLGCALAPDATSFLLCRALQGVAAAGGPVLVRALVNDHLDRLQAARLLALLTAVMAFSAMLTPIAGGWIVGRAGWQTIFLCMTGLGLLLLATSAHVIRESLPPARRLARLSAAEVAYGYLEIARRAAFWCYVLPPALMFATVFAYVSANSFLIIDRLGVAERHHGGIYAIAACAFVAGSLTSHRLVLRAGIERAIVTGLALGNAAACLACAASLLLPLSLPLVVLPGVATFFATALVVPIAAASAVSLFPHRAGSASAVAGCTQISIAALGTAASALLVDQDTLPMHAFTLACMLAAALVWRAGAGIRARELARHGHAIAGA